MKSDIMREMHDKLNYVSLNKYIYQRKLRKISAIY